MAVSPDASSDLVGNPAAAHNELTGAREAPRNGAIAGAGIPIETTRPERLLRHNISDEDLEMLAGLRREGLSEVFWGLFGASIVSLPPSIAALVDTYSSSPPAPLTVLHLVEIAISAAAITATVLTLIIWRVWGHPARDLVSEIKKRPRQ